MNVMVEAELFTAYNVGVQGDVNVSHLQFADDTLLVGAKSWAIVRYLKAVLILIEVITSLKINFHKSMLVVVNVNDSWLHVAALC